MCSRARTSPAAADDRLLERFAYASHLSRGVTDVVQRSVGEGVSSNLQVAVLVAVHGADSLTPGRLAESLGVSRASVSRVLRSLSRHHLVAAVEDPRDRRSRRLVLTPEGVARVHRLVAATVRWLRGTGGRDLDRMLQGHEPPPAEPVSLLEALAAPARAAAAYTAELEVVSARFGIRSPFDRGLVTTLDAGVVPPHPGDLAAWMWTSPATISHHLTLLEDAGLVCRTTPGETMDQRRVVVRLTPRGLAASREVLEVFRRHQQVTLDAFAALRAAVPTAAPHVTDVSPAAAGRRE